MKNDQEIMQSVRAAIDDCTRGLDEAPSMRYQLARSVKREKPALKRASVSMILVIALIVVSMTTALAAGLGLFGQLAAEPDADDRLPALEETSESVSVLLTQKDDITVEIGQAYYEGNRVFMSYRLSGSIASAELHEGAPEDGCHWNDVLENFIAAEEWTSDFAEIQKAHEWLDGKGQRWAVTTAAFLQDGLYLEDGTYLNIIGGDDALQADGSLIGWKECEIPADKLADTLTFKAVLSRSRQVMFQDGSTYMRQVEHGESTDVLFSLDRNDRYVYLKGDAAAALYQAQVEFASGQVDMKGIIRMTVPEAWAQSWTAPETEESPDTIITWSLYCGDTLLSNTGTQSVRLENSQCLVFEQLYPRMADLDRLTLVPEYSRTGEHPDEAIGIFRIVE